MAVLLPLSNLVSKRAHPPLTCVTSFRNDSSGREDLIPSETEKNARNYLFADRKINRQKDK